MPVDGGLSYPPLYLQTNILEISRILNAVGVDAREAARLAPLPRDVDPDGSITVAIAESCSVTPSHIE